MEYSFRKQCGECELFDLDMRKRAMGWCLAFKDTKYLVNNNPRPYRRFTKSHYSREKFKERKKDGLQEN